MTLLKNVVTETKKKVKKCRKGVVAVGLKELNIPNYLPKPERSVELDFILNDPKLLKKVEGFVIEIQDFDYVTYNCRRFEKQKTLEKGLKTPYDKFKEKILIIDNAPEQLYYKCKERDRFLKLNDIPQSLKKLVESNYENYEENWREIYNNKKGLDVQTWILKTHSSMGADIVMAFVPYISKPSYSLLRIAHEMNIKLQDAFSISTKDYDAEPSISYSLNYKVFNDKKFSDRLIELITEFAELQEKRAEDRDIKKVSFVFIKIYDIDSKITKCRKNFKKFLSQMEIIRDAYDLNFAFLDCPNLTGQLYLSSGADIFSERTTGRIGLTSTGGSGYGFGKIYLSEDEYYCNISHDEYVDKFHENGDNPLCKHDYCRNTLKHDILSNNMENYNKESRRIHQLLSRFDDVDEIIKAIEEKSMREITFKIGHSNDATLNYLNPYH